MTSTSYNSYDFGDVQSLLGSLNNGENGNVTNPEDIQLTQANLYMNDGYWDGPNTEGAYSDIKSEGAKAQVKAEYISPYSMDNSAYPNSSSANEDEFFDEITNFKVEKGPYSDIKSDGAKAQVKQEYVSPYSMDHGVYPNSSSAHEDELFDEITNFKAENRPSPYIPGSSSDDIDSQIDELIQSATQQPTPESTNSVKFDNSPLQQSQQHQQMQGQRLTPDSTLSSPIAPSSSIGSAGTKLSTGKVSKPKKARSTHNQIEKKYRTNINSKILELKDAVPALRIASETDQGTTIDDLEGLTPAAKLNKASILTKATEYIKHLENKNEILSNEIFQLRNVLTQFQHMLPQAPAAEFQPPHQSPQQYMVQPVASSNNGNQDQMQQQSDQQGQQQQQQQQQQNHRHPSVQRYFTDEVNMGLNGFVPTVHQIETAQAQLQNYQQAMGNGNGSQQQQQNQQFQHNHRDSSMSFGNKMLVGGMTALLGTQAFAGNDGGDNYDYKGLSFLPIHKIFPALSSDSGEVIFKFLRVLLVLAGAVTLFEPLIVSVLSTLYNDPKDEKKAVARDEYSVLSILNRYLQVVAIKLKFKDQIQDLEKVAKFNETFTTNITNYLNRNSGSAAHGWKRVLIYFSDLENYEIPDSVVLKDDKDSKKKTNEIASKFIELAFTKLILAKVISIKIGSVLAGLIGLNKTVDTTMLKIIKLARCLDTASLQNEDVLKITDLVNHDTEFIDSGASLYSGICDAFGLQKPTVFNGLIPGSDAHLEQKHTFSYSNIADLISSSQDMSLVNLVSAIRCQEIFDNSLIKYTKHVVRSEDEDATAEQEDNATDTESAESSLNTKLYADIVKFEKLVPKGCFKLTKSFKFFKNILKPNAEDLEEVVELIKNEACELIDFSSVQDEGEEASPASGKDKKIAKILDYAKRAKHPRQHSAPASTTLISEENYLLLTCSYILYYHSLGEEAKCSQLIKFLNVEGSLSLLPFVALFQVSLILIDDLLKEESSVGEKLSSSRETEGGNAAGNNDEDDDSSTLDMNSDRLLESRLRSIDADKSRIEQLILKSRLLVSQQNVGVFGNLDLGLKSEVTDQLVRLGKKINGYD